MGRLIDADKFKGKVIASHTGSGVIKLIAIDEVPTAYDPDKVVEQLEEHFNATNDKGARLAYHHAIQIVKGGGGDG